MIPGRGTFRVYLIWVSHPNQITPKGSSDFLWTLSQLLCFPMISVKHDCRTRNLSGLFDLSEPSKSNSPTICPNILDFLDFVDFLDFLAFGMARANLQPPPPPLGGRLWSYLIRWAWRGRLWCYLISPTDCLRGVYQCQWMIVGLYDFINQTNLQSSTDTGTHLSGNRSVKIK